MDYLLPTQTVNEVSPETVRQLLESKGVQVADLKEETLSLEDAFIGLTGKY